MCGIFGAFNKYITKDKADFCCDTLSHRGPDGRGVWFNSEGNCVLAHRRLSIIDLSDKGKQPMLYGNNRYCITFNGEIYNFLEIKKELQKKGYSFVGNSDTEVILASYMEWGNNCVKKFNGMWAFAIFDQVDNSLFLSRDRFGVKPLYYWTENDGIVFASEMKAIMPCMPKVDVNMQMINFFRIFHHYEFKDDCLIKYIKRFPAGYNAFFKKGKIIFERYWNTLEQQLDVPSRYEEQVEIFRELFLDACKLRMRSDVKLGTALSGGLDSSAVICAMNSVAKFNEQSTQKDWQNAYVASFKGTKLDEANYAKIVTDYIGINNKTITMSNCLSEKKLLQQAYLFEELWMNSQMPIMAIYEAERTDGTVVSIDGHGADELFSGYTMDMQFALLDYTNDNINDVARTIKYAENIGKLEEFNDYEKWISTRLKKVKKRNIYEKFYRKVILHYNDVNDVKFKRFDNLNKALYIETHKKILPTMLRNYDRNSMSSGVEIRMPFMDYRIIQFAFSIPGSSKIRNGYSKAIIRDALKDIMPYEICYRKDKKGLNAPINEWMRDSGELYLDIVNSQDFKNSNVVLNPKKIRKKLETYIKNPKEDYIADLITGQKLWQEINMYIWEKALIKNRVNEYLN